MTGQTTRSRQFPWTAIMLWTEPANLVASKRTNDVQPMGEGSARLTLVRTAPASVDAVLHVADALAISRALVADLGAFAAEMLVVLGVHQHEVCGRAADLRAGQHQAEMPRLDMLSAGLEAVGHRITQAGLIAAKARVDAVLHLLRYLMHVQAPVRFGRMRRSEAAQQRDGAYERHAHAPL